MTVRSVSRWKCVERICEQLKNNPKTTFLRREEDWHAAWIVAVGGKRVAQENISIKTLDSSGNWITERLVQIGTLTEFFCIPAASSPLKQTNKPEACLWISTDTGRWFPMTTLMNTWRLLVRDLQKHPYLTKFKKIRNIEVCLKKCLKSILFFVDRCECSHQDYRQLTKDWQGHRSRWGSL